MDLNWWQWVFKFSKQMLLLLWTRHWRFVQKSETWRAMAVALQSANASCYQGIGVIFFLSIQLIEVVWYYRSYVWVARLRDCRSSGWCSRWNTRDGGGPTLLGGVKEVDGVGHPRASTLIPRFLQKLHVPPRICSISYSPISRPIPTPLPTKVARRGYLVVWHLRLTVDFFKIQRSAWRAQETERRQAAVRAVGPNVRRNEARGTLVTSCGCVPSVHAQPVDRFCVVGLVFCARYHIVLEDIASAVLSGWWLRPGCHAFFTIALGRSGRQGVKGGVARQSWYIYISHHPRHFGFAHFLTSSVDSDVRAEYAFGVLHTHSSVHIHGYAECSGSQHSCGITPPFSRLLGTAQHPSLATSGQARLRPLLY